MLPRIEVYKVSIYTQFLEVVIFAIMHPPPQNPLLLSLALNMLHLEKCLVEHIAKMW